MFYNSNQSYLFFRVNSRELRRIIDDAIDSSDVKPSTVRFFRGAMFNMVSQQRYIRVKYIISCANGTTDLNNPIIQRNKS